MGFVNVSECLAIRAETVAIKNWNCTVHHPWFCAISVSNNTSDNIHFKCVGIVSCPESLPYLAVQVKLQMYVQRYKYNVIDAAELHVL